MNFWPIYSENQYANFSIHIKSNILGYFSELKKKLSLPGENFMAIFTTRDLSSILNFLRIFLKLSNSGKFRFIKLKFSAQIHKY